MSLTTVWVQTHADGLVRADQIVGIDAHQTPGLSGGPTRWLLDVVLAASTGSGTREGWGVTVLHRTLIQTSEDPGQAPAALARLLSQLDLVSAAGIVATSRQQPGAADTTDGVPDGDELIAGSGRVRYRFLPFSSPAPGRRTGAEYL